MSMRTTVRVWVEVGAIKEWEEVKLASGVCVCDM